MTEDEIGTRLRALGLGWTEAAAICGVSRTALQRVAQRNLVSRPTARKLATVLLCEPGRAPRTVKAADVDVWVAEVFPDRPEYATTAAATERDQRIKAGRSLLAGVAAAI